MTALTRSQPLGEVVALGAGKSIKPGGSGVYPVYGSNGIIGRIDEYLFESGVIIGRVGAYCGCVAFSSGPFWSSDNTLVALPASDQFDIRFVYYLLHNLNLGQFAGGAAQPLVTQSVLRQIPVDVPELATQRRIAGVLSAYDDLIENCERRIRVLEEMARALYREWFVLFRYPGHEKVPMVKSAIGPLPSTWEVRTVGESFEVIGGGTPSRKEPAYWSDGTIQWYTPSDITASGAMFIDSSSETISERGLAESSARVFPSNCVMMTSRATIGAIAINTHAACTNQGFITCVPSDRMPCHLLFHWLRENVPSFERIASGATFKEISRGVFRTIQLAIPPRDLACAFENRGRPVSAELLNLQRQKDVLRRTRDLLLPRLLSGQLALSDAA